MSKLIRANFVRLWKCKAFWGSEILTVLFAGMLIFFNYKDKITYDEAECINIDGGLFAVAILIPIFVAIVTTFYLGTEYNDGTMRNKMVVGHSRFNIYIANLIVTSVASLIPFVTYVVILITVGSLALGKSTQSVPTLLTYFGYSILAILAVNAVFVCISMLIQSKAIAAVLAVVIAFMFILISSMIKSGLNEPEYYEAYVYQDENGELVEVPEELNPNYLKGTKRKVYEIEYDLIPSCQLSRCAQQTDKLGVCLPIYSAAIILVASAIGIIAFYKKDIK